MRVLAAMLLAVVLCALSMARAVSAPCIEFDKKDCDIGEVWAGQFATVYFCFKNTGDEDLEIVRIDKSCGCTAAKAEPPKVSPGQYSALQIDFRTGTAGGHLIKTITMVTNDPANPTVSVTVRGEVITLATFEPTSINFGTIGTGTTFEKTVLLTPTNADRFSIEKIESSGTRVSATFRKTDGSKPRYEITVKVAAGDTPGRVLERLAIVVALAGSPTLSFFVYGNVQYQPKTNAQPS